MSKCQYCSAYQGDNFTISEFNSPFSPTKVANFSKIIFHKIMIPLRVNAGSWSIGYPPFEYYLEDEAVDGSLYITFN